MKKYVTLSLLLSIATSVYSQAQRLVVKMDVDSTEFRHWAADGSQLPYYDLAPVVTINRGKAETIRLADGAAIYKVLAGKRKAFKVYTSAHGNDTVCLQQDRLLFSGDHKRYNLYLMEAEKADEYCRSYSSSRNHPLAKVNKLADFDAIISVRKSAEEKLLRNGSFDSVFVKQQQLFTDVRYKALFLKKLISLYKSPELKDEWIEEFNNMDLHLTNETIRQSDWFRDLLKDYICIKSFIIENVNPAEVADTFNTFLFDNYCRLLKGKNLEYAAACLLYNDVFQKEYSKDIPLLYNKFITLYPNSPYIEVLAPEVEKITALYSQGHENSQIHMVNYETEPKSFADMMRPFLGKVVYIDIWATTCAPCIKSFSEVGKMREQIPVSEDIVFLYLSVDRDRRHEKWVQMVNYYNLEGYHYRVNEHTSSIIYTTFGDARGVLTIPRYVIVDKNGKIAFDNAASPADSRKVSEQLKTLLK